MTDFSKTKWYSAAQIEAAFNNADFDDDAIANMVRTCNNPDTLMAHAMQSHSERLVRLLISARFQLSLADSYGRGLYAFDIVERLLLEVEWTPVKRSGNAGPWYLAYKNVETAFAHLIACGIDVNAANSRGFSLSHLAAQYKNEKILSMLIDAGADLTVVVRDATRTTPFFLAAANPNAAVIALLIPLSDVNATDAQDETACMRAANSLVLELLIDAGANVNAAAGAREYSALSFALEKRDEKMVDILVDAGAHVNKFSPSDRWTAMHLAVEWCNHGLLGKLIAAGGDVNALGNGVMTPCHMIQRVDGARGDDAVRSLAMLIAAGANVHAADFKGSTPLHYASSAGFADCISLLLKAGARANLRNQKGFSPLHFALNVDAAAMLVDAKADVNAVADDGRTVCHCAWENPQVLSYLIAAGANVHAKDKHGRTALHFAAKSDGRTESMSILIDAGVDVNESDGLGNSAGHLAVLARCVENLKFLLAHGAQVDKQNDAGETMLFMAAAARLVNIVDLLIDAGADLNVRNNKSVSPLFDSLASNVEIARHLLRAGASHNDIGENGCSACHVPARSGRVESLRLLLEFGANVHAVNNDGASVAHGAQGWAIPLLHSLGVNLNGVDDLGNTPCHAARDEAALVALFALGVTMTAMNNHGATPYDKFLAKKYSEEVLTFVAAGIGFGVQTQLQHGNICAIVMAGGGLVSAETDVADLRAQEGHALKRIFDRQRQLFRWRALEVCLGLQSLHVSAMEMYEILAHMFAPLECVVPFGFAWRIVCAVKHKKKE